MGGLPAAHQASACGRSLARVSNNLADSTLNPSMEGSIFLALRSGLFNTAQGIELMTSSLPQLSVQGMPFIVLCEAANNQKPLRILCKWQS